MQSLVTSDYVLAGVCLIVSTLNASVGTTGGVTFATMANVLPPLSVIPIHGLVESVSSAFRWAMLREFVDHGYWRPFVLGTLIGFMLGWPLIGSFSDAWLRVMLGVAILILAWMPIGWLNVSALTGGISSTVVSVLVGASGPLVAALLSRSLDRHQSVIATHGACTAIQHGGKAMLFGALGFSFYPYLPLIAVLIVAIACGTWVGRKLLLRVPERLLRSFLKIIVTLLGVRLIYLGYASLAGR